MKRHGSTRIGSAVDRALEMLEPLGEISQKDFTKHLTAMVDSKAQAQALAGDLLRNGFVVKTVRLTSHATGRKRVRS